MIKTIGNGLFSCGALLGLLLLVAAPVEAGSRTFCAVKDVYAGKTLGCGGHLEPECISGEVCHAGHNQYNGSPFPITIDCPHIFEEVCSPVPWPPFEECVTIVDVDIPDEKLHSGCYNRIPTCNDCGGHGQPPCPAEAEPICGGCDDGHVRNSVTKLCELPGTPGQPCGLNIGCSGGLVCDQTRLQCVAKAQAGESCANPFVPCDDGLQCTLALECSHEPAQLGETCGVSVSGALVSCDEGLFCQAGIPARCVAKARPGERCDLLLRPCTEGTVCAANLGQENLCYPDPFAGEISQQQCSDYYSGAVAAGIPFLQSITNDPNLTRIYSGGIGISALSGTFGAFGVAYDPYGRYGCFKTLCTGIDIDISVEAFVADGVYNDSQEFYGIDVLSGYSTAIVEEAQIPFSPFNYAASQVFAGSDPFNLGELIGTEQATSIGLGASPIPVSGGTFVCDTQVTPVVGDIGGGIVITPLPDPIPGPPPPPPLSFGALAFDGSDDAVALIDPADADQLVLADAMTLEAWIRPLVGEQTATLLAKAGEYSIGLLGGSLVYQLANSSPGWGALRNTGVQPEPFRWTHVALVYGNNESSVFINGEPVHAQGDSGAVGDAVPEDATFVIGRDPSGAAPFAGHMDSVRVWSRTLSQVELIAGLDALPDVTDTNLVAGWQFDEPDGNTLFDVSAAGLNLALDSLGAESAPLREVDGRAVIGGALNFDGSDDHVSLDVKALYDGLAVSDALTLEAWIYPLGDGGHPTFGGLILSKENEYSLGRMPDGRINFALANSSPGWTTVVTTAEAPIETWTHVALSYDSALGQVDIYINGELAESHAASGAVGHFTGAEEALRIGGRKNDDATATKQAFDGIIDEVRIWNISRTGEQINASYADLIDPDSEGLAGYWRFDEGPLDVAFESTGATRHGLLGSGRSWQMPKRIDSARLPGFPADLLHPVCSNGNCVLDADGDAVSDYIDNCTLAANAGQLDTDSDGYGNRCDPDFDNNLTVDFADLVFLKSVFFSGDPEADLNGDSKVDFADLVIMKSMFFGPPGPSSLAR